MSATDRAAVVRLPSSNLCGDDVRVAGPHRSNVVFTGLLLGYTPPRSAFGAGAFVNAPAVRDTRT